jgi:hypothetical protein
VTPALDGPAPGRPNIAMWAGYVVFAERPETGRFRLQIEEHEYVASGEPILTGSRQSPRGRVVYAESFELDSALLNSH